MHATDWVNLWNFYGRYLYFCGRSSGYFHKLGSMTKHLFFAGFYTFGRFLYSLRTWHSAGLLAGNFHLVFNVGQGSDR